MKTTYKTIVELTVEDIEHIFKEKFGQNVSISFKTREVS
jgi:hypothetical protein